MTQLRNLYAEGYPAIAYMLEVREQFRLRDDVTAAMAGHAIIAAGYPAPEKRLNMLVNMDDAAFERLCADMFRFFEREVAPTVRKAATEWDGQVADAEVLWAAVRDPFVSYQNGALTLAEAAESAADVLGVAQDSMRDFFSEINSVFNRALFSQPAFSVAISGAYHGHDHGSQGPSPILGITRELS